MELRKTDPEIQDRFTHFALNEAASQNLRILHMVPFPRELAGDKMQVFFTGRHFCYPRFSDFPAPRHSRRRPLRLSGRSPAPDSRRR